MPSEEILPRSDALGKGIGRRPPIVFYAFDLLQLNGKDLRNLPIEDRKAKLEELLKKPSRKSRQA
jgi:bifunctional non-homologous end joining protein LigD